MIDFNKMIKVLSKEEIQKIISTLQTELDERQQRIKKFEFYFTASNIPRKYHPYVARLLWVNGKIQRQFFNFKRSYHKDNTVSVYGKYEVPAGAVLEKRYNEDGKQWFLVTSDGKQKEFGFYADKEGKQIMMDYLKGSLTIDEVEKRLNEKDFENYRRF